MATVRVHIRDYSGEPSTFAIEVPALTSANIDATITAAVGFQNALNDLIIGGVYKRTLSAQENLFTPIVSDPFAQREIKWFVPFTDNVNPDGDGHFTIATPDLSLLVPGTDLLDVASAEWTAFVAAVGVLPARSSLGNAITLGQPYVVGRRG